MPRVHRAIAMTGALIALIPAVGRSQDTTPQRLLRGAAIMPARATPAPKDTSYEKFGGNFSHHVLSNGAIVVVHTTARRVLYLDSTLTWSRTLFDAATPAPLAYPASDARQYAAPADSTYFFDRPARAFRVLRPDGTIARTRPIVDSANFALIVSQPGGRFDARGRLLMVVPQEKRVATGRPRQLRDSVYLVRIGLDRRGRDTIATMYHRQSELRGETPDSSGRAGPSIARVMPIFDIGDAWTLTSRNEIVILRADDYTLHWLGADEKWRVTERLPWPKLIIPADAKASMLQQARAAAARLTPTPELRGQLPPGARIVVQIDDSVTDRVPVFIPMSAAPDLDGGFWIHSGSGSMGRAQGIPEFLHIDASGKIIDHVYIPLGRFLQGVTRDGFMFVASTPMGGRYEHVVLPPRPPQ